MRRRFFGIAGTALTGLALSGCAQMTRHSNTLVFGTNTSFGIKVGTDATSTPGITVGYSRQEAVVMPLVANTDDDGTTQKPCPKPTAPSGNAIIDASCILVGKKALGNPSNPDSDAYSVMASFGAKFGASGKPGDPNATGQIAQYFATGIAARELAEHAGAAAVSTAEAATESVKLHGPRDLVDAINIPDDATRTAIVNDTARIMAGRGTVAGKIGGSGVKLAELLQSLDKAAVGKAGSGSPFSRACKVATGVIACAQTILDPKTLGGLEPDQWERAAAVTIPN